ncbi:MAG: sugar transferase [Chloroflexi bacterium]|nr:sugar transferase [Chloroflexota bacterium]
MTKRHTRGGWRLLVIGLVSLDIVGLALAVVLAYNIRFVLKIIPYESPLDPGFYVRIGLGIIPVWLSLFWIYHLYDRNVVLGGLREYASVVSASGLGIVLLMLVSFFFLRQDAQLSRGWIVLLWGVSILFVGSLRFAARRVVYWMRSKGWFVRRTIVAGADYQGIALARHMSPPGRTGVEIVGFVHEYLAPGSIVGDGFRILGDPMDLESLANENEADLVIVVPSALSWESMQSVMLAAVSTSSFECRVLPGLYDVVTIGVTLDNSRPTPLLSLQRMRITGFNLLLKSVLDYGLSALLLVVTLPLAALLVLLSIARRRPIIEGRRYLGIGGKPFQMLAFGGWWDGKSDGNSNGLEGFLRGRRLYRLPGLINVLRGDMSLVGPRHILSEDLSRQSRWQHAMFSVKPGLTGPWLLAGADRLSLQESLDLRLVHLDLQYVRNYTIWLDLEILYRTLKLFLFGGFRGKTAAAPTGLPERPVYSAGQ